MEKAARPRRVGRTLVVRTCREGQARSGSLVGFDVGQHRNALFLRGLAWQRAGRDDLAVRDLEAVVPLFGEDDVARSYVLRRLLDSSIRLHDPKRARRWITTALSESNAGEILLESIRKRPGIEALFTPADWDRFEAVTRR